MEPAKTSFIFPGILWRKVRTKAAQEGITVVGVLTELLERWVKGDIKLHEKEKVAA